MWWMIPTAEAQTFMPPAASDVAAGVDSLYGFLLICSLISFIILIGGMMYFLYKYRRKSVDDKTAYITHDARLEFAWSFIPFVIFMVSFGWGTKLYLDMRNFTEDSLEINVYGKKWVWEFTYKNGRKITPELDENNKPVPPTITVPVNKPVKLIMTSVKVNPENKLDRAVLHSFFIPAFRVKQDVVPGRYTGLYFKPTKTGTFQVFCTEYCGTNHSQMLARVRVVPQLEFDNWVLGEGAVAAKEMSLADLGKKLYATRACIGCHSLDGSTMPGPTWKGLFGSNRSFKDGSSGPADENYLRESILNSQAKIVKGFEAASPMPAYQGQLTEEEITQLIEFIKSVK